MEDPAVVPVASLPLTRYHLIMFLDGGVSLSRSLTRIIQKELESIPTPPDQTAIDVWLESTGGDAHATYKLFLELRSRCTELRVIVPDYAKSAATLLTLGVDKLFMAAAAELGPLDVQLEHPDREGVTISGLEAAGSLEFITKTAFAMVLTGGGSLVDITGLPRAHVLKETLGFMGSFYQPIIEKFDPHLISQASKQLKIAERYATTMLQSRRIAKDEHLDGESTKRLLQRLVKDYPAHEFIISRDEAQGLGLPIAEAESHPRWTNLKRLYDAPRDEGASVICVIPDAEIEKREKAKNSRAATATEKGNHEEKNLHQPRRAKKVQPNGSGEGSTTAERVEEIVRAKAGGGN